MNEKPWLNEPDFVELKTDNRYHAIVWRNPQLGNLNGYVGVKPYHPWYGLHPTNDTVCDCQVHGGITYAGNRYDEVFKKGYWYFGFDTAHFNDLVPYLQTMKETVALKKEFEPIGFPGFRETYRTIDFVSAETLRLLEQIEQARKDKPQYTNHKRFYKKLRKKIQVVQIY